MTELYQRFHNMLLQAQNNYMASTLPSLINYHQGRIDALNDMLVMLEDRIRMEAEQD